ncbi:type I iterative polyketide synthase [Penicillium taxi]|uniref:type I iterative polyketide synthase n=1 Tax=Penicillium taxi TaxID=168475 RepID=UPI002545AA1E|nr:type I iterative polyketide synthase [Penicillium taxi]KAJ5888153.1 type I iterative polyketide synthase [Penicillium taxi]
MSESHSTIATQPPEIISQTDDTQCNGLRSLCQEKAYNIGSTISSNEAMNVSEPLIAITGMAMRLPGGVRTAEDFWNLLMKGKDGHGRVPSSRYNISAYHSQSKPHSVRAEGGYFLQDDITKFDTGFFGVRPQLAAALDPQQRLLSEVVWECFENAGETKIAGKRIGCFVGVFGNDWQELALRDEQDYDRNLVGCTHDFVLANQVSQLFDLMGPSVTIRTACSSSMIALHTACEAIKAGECDAAIVAGTNLILTPTTSTVMFDYKALSPSGICKTFDADADGYGRGEAINAVLIKKLDDALQRDDPVRAVIRATAINSDGKVAMAGVPRAEGQEQVIRLAYTKAGIDDFSQTGLFECHGTGTQKGDVIETSVVANVFRDGILMGSVKPNVGHSEGASGLTSLIKAVLCLENRLIPPNIHFHSPNPNIPFETAKLGVPVEPTPWPKDRSDRVSINCFGVGGSNAHVILESKRYFTKADPEIGPHDRLAQHQLLVISAKSEESLSGCQAQILRYIESHPDSQRDLAYTLGKRREHLRNRGFLVTDGKSVSPGRTLQLPQDGNVEAVTLIFSGQGAQWPGMGRGLIGRYENFQNDIRKMDYALQSLKDAPTWRIEGTDSHVLYNPNCPDLNDAEFAQPLCTALQIGLVNLLAYWGIQPDSVAGHSSGEIAAAYAAGAIPMSMAIILSYYRGKVTKLQKEPGMMASVGLGRSEVSPYLEKGVVVACENSPRNVTLSGIRGVLDRILSRISSDHPDVFCKALPVDVAYHSELVLEAAQKYSHLIEPHIRPNVSMIPMFSCITGQPISSPKDLDAMYWRCTMESPVNFKRSIRKLIHNNDQNRMFVEVGPQSVLLSSMRQIFEVCNVQSKLTYAPTLLKGKNSMDCLLRTAGELYLHGVQLDMTAINGNGKVLTNLPPYVWQHGKQLWYESRMSHNWRQSMFAHDELLGRLSPESSVIEPFWRNRLQVKFIPWLLDHKIGSDIVYPCVGYVFMIGEAIRQITGSKSFSIKRLFMNTPMVLGENSTTEVLTNFRPMRLTDSTKSSWYDVTISAYDGKQWSIHCTAQVKGGKEDHPSDFSSQHKNYARREGGLDFGPSFRRLRAITVDPTSYHASATIVQTEEGNQNGQSCVEPVAIDQGLQLLGIAACNGLSRRMFNLGIPMSIDYLHIANEHKITESEVTLQAEFPIGENGTLKTSLGGCVSGVLNKKLLFTLKGVKFFPLPQSGIHTNIPLSTRLEWKPDIDFLPAKEYLFKSMPDNPSMLLLAKLMVIAVIDLFDQLGIRPLSFDSAAQYQDWTTTNLGRLHQILQFYFPDSLDWSLDPVSLQSMLIRDVSAIVESTEPWVQPIRDYVTQILDAIDDQVPLSELLMDERGFRSLYEFAATNVDLGQTFSLLGHSNPSLAVLEVNPGTCGTTSGALVTLRSGDGIRLYSKYTVASDCSNLRTEAIDRFGETEGFSCVALNPKITIGAHGFDSKSYDLIIIPNDLPSVFETKSLLADLRSLLTPEGRLLIREVTPPVPFIDFMMSMLPAPLSISSDIQLESSYSSDFWTTELTGAGFLTPEFHSFNLNIYPWTLKQAIISKVPQPEPEKQNVFLLGSTQTHKWAETVRQQLIEQGYNVVDATIEELPSGKGDVISLLDVPTPFLSDFSPEKHDALMKLCLEGRLTIWATKSSQMKCDNPSSGLITGFARTIRQETKAEFGTLEIDNFNQHAATTLVKVYEKLRRQSLSNNWAPEYEFALLDGVVHVGRFHWVPLEKIAPPAPEDCHLTLEASAPGIGKSVTWKERPTLDLNEQDVEVDMCYVGVNFRLTMQDIMVTMGIIDREHGLGLEGSGIIHRVGPGVMHLQPGQRVSFLGIGLLATRVVIPSNACFPLPDEISLEDAATIPVAYRTAIYSLLTVGQLERGQSVLIHSACGAVGQAAIRIAQTMKAKIYATVGTDQKAQYLQEIFDIPRENIFESRNASFVDGIKSATGGQGVDIVLNSLSENLLHASWSCVAKFGKMIELGKRDFLGHGMLDMETFGANRSFIGVDLLQLGLESPSRARRYSHQAPRNYEFRLSELFARLAQRGKIKPIQPVKIFSPADIPDAFAYMQRGTHIGKILIHMNRDTATQSLSKKITVAPLTTFKSDAAYLLVGGLGGIGRAVSNWLVENGARHLIYLSRSGKSPSNEAFIQELQAQGCQPVVINGSVSNIEDVEHAIAVSPKPISGVINLGMVQKPSALSESSYEDWVSVQDPKVKGSWNLHKAFSLAALDFFVVISSITSLCGSIGQASYASANAYLDALIRHRRSLGLPGATLNLGGVGDIGCFAREPEWITAANFWKLRLLNEEQVIESVEAAIRLSQTSYGSHGILATGQVITGMSTTRTQANPAYRIPWKDARYRLYANVSEAKGDVQQERIADKFKHLLRQSQQNPVLLKEQQGWNILLEYIGLQMNEKAGTDAERAQLATMAIDSILLIEAVGNIRRNFGLELTLTSLAGANTVGDLSRVILERLYEKMAGDKKL